MSKKAVEKIADSLAQFLEGYTELKAKLDDEYGVENDETEIDDEETETTEEFDAALITELKAAIETALESEDYSPDILANAIVSMTEALEEIDPDIFESSDDDEDEEEEEDDIDDDLDDDDLDEDELDEEEEDEEDEDD